MNPQHRERLVEMKSGGVPAASYGGEEGMPTSGPRSLPTPIPAAPARPVPFRPEEVHLLVERWVGVQNAFIEDPRRAVQQADQLIAEIGQRLLGVIEGERAAMRGMLENGEASTEELRLAMRRYRALFDLLLTM